MSKAEEKIVGVELLRFLSAFAVIAWHYQQFALVPEAPALRPEAQPFHAALWIFYDKGGYGVHVFWCISGFIFFWKYGDRVAARVVSAREFAVNRFSRLYPLHFVTLLVAAALQHSYHSIQGSYFAYPNNDARHFLLQLVLASNWGFERGFSFNGPIWSISMEVLAYAVFFVIARTLGTSVVVTGTIAVAAAVVHWLAGPNDWHLLYMSACIMLFYAGGLACAAFQWLSALGVTAQRIVSGVLVLVLAVVAGDFVTTNTISLAPALVLGSTLLVILAARYVRPRGARATRVLEALGDLTYSSYLLHFPLQLAIVTAFAWAGAQVPMYRPWFFVAFVALTFGLAAVVFRAFERPAQRALRRMLQ